jgi:hypothetical protein
MAQPLDYDSYKEGDEKGNKNKNARAGVLANRPLPSIESSSYKSPVDCPSCSSHIRPANKNDVYKVDHLVSPNDREKPISMVLKQGVEPGSVHVSAIAYDEEKESDYFFSELDVEPVEPEKEKEKEKKEMKKMDFATQLYIGSLSVVGLYIVFRLMFKMKH